MSLTQHESQPEGPTLLTSAKHDRLSPKHHRIGGQGFNIGIWGWRDTVQPTPRTTPGCVVSVEGA